MTNWERSEEEQDGDGELTIVRERWEFDLKNEKTIALSTLALMGAAREPATHSMGYDRMLQLPKKKH